MPVACEQYGVRVDDSAPPPGTVAAHLWQLPGADAYRAKFAQWLTFRGVASSYF